MHLRYMPSNFFLLVRKNVCGLLQFVRGHQLKTFLLKPNQSCNHNKLMPGDWKGVSKLKCGSKRKFDVMGSFPKHYLNQPNNLRHVMWRGGG